VKTVAATLAANAASAAGEADGEDTREPLQKLLIDMLTIAVALEFSTIPPYLCALWSIKDDLHPVAKSIREVAQEEMLHMGLACNMLVAVGGSPEFLKSAAKYPTALPGDVHKGLVVNLQGLNQEALLEFLWIEAPDEVSPLVDEEEGDPTFDHSATIGKFYRSILEAFRCWDRPYIMEGQVTASLVWRSIGSIEDVEKAIQLILDQGEGAELGDGKPGPSDSWHQDLAHYYRFLEVYKEKRLEFDKKSGRFVWKKGYKRPETLPMAKVPTNGHVNGVPDDVRELLFEFNAAYTSMLTLLEKAWNPEGGGQGNVVHAIGKMFSLERPAKALMAIPIGSGPETYGPDFRIIQPL